jgi:hypothetical protein
MYVRLFIGGGARHGVLVYVTERCCYLTEVTVMVALAPAAFPPAAGADIYSEK